MTPIVPPPTVRLPAADDGRFRLYFQAGDFVGGQNRHHFGHARPAFQRFLVDPAIVADGGDHGPFGADDHMAFQAQRFDACDHVRNILGGGLFFHDDNHGWGAPFL